MSSAPAKSVEKGPALSTEEPVRDTVGVRAAGSYDAIMALQRHAGNQAVSTLLTGSSGGPLDLAAREEMESRFGADFREVRIHRNETATNAALAGARGRSDGFQSGSRNGSAAGGRRRGCRQSGLGPGIGFRRPAGRRNDAR